MCNYALTYYCVEVTIFFSFYSTFLAGGRRLTFRLLITILSPVKISYNGMARVITQMNNGTSWLFHW